MGSSFVLVTLITTTISLSLPSLSHSSSPTAIPSSPTISPFEQLSPEIAPLLPSPGGAHPSADGSSAVPTIPSSPSPPDPDTDLADPDPAFAPAASPPASSPAPPRRVTGAVSAAAAALFFCTQLLGASVL
ncbi:PREDICTED: classical arabinogalactan protein 25-like [Tarenaya hassleriana]|uniref:classical arabinogalactan protein 25-like n=1 Tax=Tarenaya hassleriana TaxID=28532 RepID=UPI00053C3864|nr:PREDICTED: classical arabinogalactan protein 25-like [Tarenaya hassleriana]